MLPDPLGGVRRDIEVVEVEVKVEVVQDVEGR